MSYSFKTVQRELRDTTVAFLEAQLTIKIAASRAVHGTPQILQHGFLAGAPADRLVYLENCTVLILCFFLSSHFMWPAIGYYNYRSMCLRLPAIMLLRSSA